MGFLRSTFLHGVVLAIMFAGLVAAEPLDNETNQSRHIEASAYLVKVDGKEVFLSNPQLQQNPASLVKMMTALLVLERISLDEVVKVRLADRVEGSRIGLVDGEEIKAGYLLAALLMRSANDACLALSTYIAGSVDDFVKMMNAEAVKRGLLYTHFSDPCGLSPIGNYSSVRDLASLAESLMQSPFAAKVTATARTTIVNKTGSRIILENNNELIGRYPGAIGVKTGTSSVAGPCLVAIAERDGTRVLVVLLNAPDRWSTAVDLLNRGFASTLTKQNQ